MFGDDPAFDGVTAQHDVGLGQGHRLAGGDPDLLADEIDAADHLADRVFDLQARVHLDEMKFAVLVQELDGADAAIVQLGDGIDDPLADFGARRRVQGGGGRFLDDLWWRRWIEQSRSPKWMTLPLPSPRS